MQETPDWHPARYLASVYSAPSERALLEALFGIESEIVASLAGGLDHHVAHVRLQWWREECERATQGRPAHPLTRAAVSAFAGQSTTSLGGLSGFVDTTVWDLASATFETRRELAAYCERWAAAMIVPVVTHAIPEVTEHGAWLSIGSALHEIEMLANLASEAHSGRLRMPLDELELAGVEPNSLATVPWSAQLAELLKQRHEALRGVLAAEVGALPRTQQDSVRGILVWIALAWRRSVRAQRALPNSLQPARFDALADGWVAWRAARGAMAGNFSFSLSLKCASGAEEFK